MHPYLVEQTAAHHRADRHREADAARQARRARRAHPGDRTGDLAAAPASGGNGDPRSRPGVRRRWTGLLTPLAR